MKEVKWVMNNVNDFVGTLEGYTVNVVPHTDLYPYWMITKDDVVIDTAMQHSPVTTDWNKELACKVQAQRVLNKILDNIKPFGV